MSIKNDFQKYVDFKIIPFSVNINGKVLNAKGEYKKDITWSKKSWKNSTLENPIYNENFNSIGLKTVKKVEFLFWI